MVVSLGPGKFYGSSLPRPRIYTDVKLNDERVNPPVPVMDALMSWANEAHWSMGGLSFQRLRLQGKVEGNIQKLKKEKEKILRSQSETPIYEMKKEEDVNGGTSKGKKRGSREDSPPPAPISRKTRRRWALMDEEVEEEDGPVDDSEEERESEGEKKKMKKRRLVRKLGDDFEIVAGESGGSQEGVISEGVSTRTRSRRSSMVVAEECGEEAKTEKNKGKGSVSPAKKMSKKNVEKGSASPPNGNRSSPRLKKKSS